MKRMKTLLTYEEGLIELKRQEHNLIIADFMNILDVVDFDCLGYDSDWDMLIPVYSEIMFKISPAEFENDNDGEKVCALQNHVEEAIYNNRIDNAFSAIVEFLQWYKNGYNEYPKKGDEKEVNKDKDGVFFLFGEATCFEYEDSGDLDKVAEYIKRYVGDIYHFTKLENSTELLMEFNGWSRFHQITKDEYIELSNLIKTNLRDLIKKH